MPGIFVFFLFLFFVCSGLVVVFAQVLKVSYMDTLARNPANKHMEVFVLENSWNESFTKAIEKS